MGERLALVTGAARGIGAAIATRLCADGITVLAIDLPGSTRLAPAVNRIDLELDVADPSSITKAIESVVSRFGRLDILVNNAGIFARTPLAKPDQEKTAHAIFAVNAHGPRLMIEAFTPLLQNGKLPAIVNIASVRGLTASERASAYSISKAMVIDVTKRCARDLAPIRCNAVAPGDIARSMSPPEPDILAKLLPRIPLGRMGRPEEVASVVAFLASPRSQGINGAILPVDGGFLCT